MPNKKRYAENIIYAIEGTKISELDFFKNKVIHHVAPLPSRHVSIVNFSFHENQKKDKPKQYSIEVQFLKPTKIILDDMFLFGVSLDNLISSHPVTINKLAELKAKKPEAIFVIYPTYFGDFAKGGSWSYQGTPPLKDLFGRPIESPTRILVQETNSQSIEIMNFGNNKINKSVITNRDSNALDNTLFQNFETEDLVFFGFEIKEWTKSLENKLVYTSQPLAVQISITGFLLGK